MTFPHQKQNPITRSLARRSTPRSAFRLWAIVGLLGVQSLASCVSQNPPDPGPNVESYSELYFGVLSTEDQSKQQDFWQTFLGELGDDLGIPVKPFYAQQYDDLIQGMRAQEIQLAWLGGKAYIEAAQSAGAEAFALTVAADGSQGYTAHLISHRDQPFVPEAQTLGGEQYVLQQGSNLTFAFNDPSSTSGFLVPNYYIFTTNQIKPEALFRQVSFLGTHELTALAVVDQTVDIATSNNEALDRLAKSHPTAHEQVAVLWTSPLIPNDPISYQEDLPEVLKRQIEAFFWDYDNPELLKQMEWSGFVEADDTTWNPVRKIKISQQILDIEANPKIDAAEKEKMLQELETTLQQLSGAK